MPLYNYACLDCERKAAKQLKRELTISEYESLVLFETSHGYTPSAQELKEATECPRCHGHNCERSYHGSNVLSYIRGNGWLDHVGVRRDLNMHTLTQDDPYAQYREPGEVEHLKTKIKRAGQHDPKTKHFVNTGMQEAVSKAVHTQQPKDD